MRVYSYIELKWNEKTQRYDAAFTISSHYDGMVARCKGGGGPSEEAKELERRQLQELDELKRRESQARAAIARGRRGRASLIRNIGGEAGLEAGKRYTGPYPSSLYPEPPAPAPAPRKKSRFSFKGFTGGSLV